MTSHLRVKLAIGFLLACSCFPPAEGTHFRGAIIQWSPADSVAFNGTIVITHRIAWRRGRAFCDASTIASDDLIGQAGNLVCRIGCFGNVGSMQFYCTDFSESEDWSSGQRTYTYDMSGVNYFEASYTGGDWIDELQSGSDARWEVRVKGSLSVRPDTGRINTSPITAISPILRLQHGCNHTIDIPTDDVDGDEVRCRWARYFSGECSGVCEAFPGAILDERNCQLQYAATGNIGWYAVALQMEDFATPIATTPLSSVPVQFLVLVFSSDEACSQKPEFIGITRVAGSCIGVPFNTTFHEPLIAMSGGPNVSIVSIDTVSPQGIRKSSLLDGPGEHQWHVNITWSPDQSQLGPNILCYTAMDNLGLASNQWCITLVGGVEAPNYITETIYPTGEILPNHTQWSIGFDKQFLRPASSRFFRIIGKDGSEALKINAAISPSVAYPEGSLGRELQFTTSYLFAERMQYYVILDPGVAVGPDFCGPESPALRDPNIWVVSIADVTPPTLVLLTEEQFSNENFTINWNVSEEVTAICTLQTPAIQYTEICNNKSFTATQLQEGLHFLFVQATDLSGNPGPALRYGWIVDLTPPTVILTSFPHLILNATEWSFTYECTDEMGCSFSCSAHEVGQLSQFSPCGTSYHVDGLINGRNYEFEVIAIDIVGNEGHLAYQWKIDITPPVISSISDVTVPCGQDLSPSAIGIPQVTDNDDPQPTVEYEDMPSDGCRFRRLWIASDNAGNTANRFQLVTLTSPIPPEIIAQSILTLPCGSVQDVILLLQELPKFFTVRHPCSRPVEITFTDSTNVDRCGFSFSRTWLVEDDCGGSNTFLQTIRILDQEFPDAPENGQLNTDINQPLIWPQRSGAFSYEVYIWRFGHSRPALPTVVTTMRRYQPASPYPPATRMLWQVEYRTDVNVTVPSPVWGFETEAFSDFVMTEILLPPFAFSGQNFDVAWSVINVGNLSSVSSARNWYDRVWLGPTQDISESRVVATVLQRRILDPNDGYTSQAVVELHNNEIGIFYLFVETDIFRRVNDIDYANNRKTATSPLEVRLTPPPNLVVMDINIPQSTFSGESIVVGWTVENTGIGVTAADQWYDRVYWSDDQQIDNDDLVLGEFRILDVLPPGAMYTQSETVTIPKAIFGDFFIIVDSDIHNQVYEHNNEEDNARVSDNPIAVTLSPPPDLVVSSLTVEEEYHTGSEMVINYTVTNNGAGAPFESFWTDRTVLIDESGAEIALDTSLHYGTLQPGESYSKQVQYFISPNLAAGQYNVTVHTDIREQVFEFRSNDNNMLTSNVHIMQRLSDLTVTRVETSVRSSSEGSTVMLNYTVMNTGRGSSIGSPWIDRVGVSDSQSSDANVDFVASYRWRNELQPSQSYSVNLLVTLTSDTFGELYIHVITDYYNRIIEEDDQNNRNISGPVSVPFIQPDLVVESFQVNGDKILSGDEVQLSWTVANLGSATLKNERWTDSIYLSMSSDLSSQATRLKDYTMSYALRPTESYTFSAAVIIPDGLFGRYYLFVQTDNFQRVDEIDETENNVYSLSLFLEIPSSPDLLPNSISVNYSEDVGFHRVLTIHWSVLNVGSNMKDEASWTDQLFVSNNALFDQQNVISIATTDVVGQLGANQEYFMTKAVILPVEAFGGLYVYVEVDSGNVITEISAEDNNIGRSTTQVSVPEFALPQLATQIITHTLPSSGITGEKVSFQYLVSNLGAVNLPLSSWTDGVYLVTEENVDRNTILEDGILIHTILHNRAVHAGEQFTVLRNISIPFRPNQHFFFAVVLDINGNLGDPADIGVGGSIHSETSFPLFIEQGPLPDLVALPPLGNLTTHSGQPLNVTLRVGNVGNNTAIGFWYGALYLSQDALLDPFDSRLISVLGPTSLDAGMTHEQTVEIFLPFDLPSASYYLFYEVDVGNSIPEQSESENNIDRQVITILQTISTDLAVASVSITPSHLIYESDLTAAWTLRNNGTVLAEGYKCDTMYLSEDDVWDLMDHELADAQCGHITIYPHNGNDGNDLSYQLMEVTPYIAEQAYTGIVVSRSNIRDVNGGNNIGMTQHTLYIQALSISLNTPTTITLQQGQSKVYRIDYVPVEETLVATLKASTLNTFHDLFLRHGKTPTDFEYDAISRRPLSVNQRCVVRSTRDGTYYLRIESSASTMEGNYSVEVLVKIAVFEILEVSPSKAAPLGNVTLLLSGTVIGYAVEAFIYNADTPSEIHSASRVYWFSSEEVYATFDITDFPFGNYTVRLTDRRTAAVAELAIGFQVTRGIPGQATIQVMPPRPLRSEESGQVSVLIQNAGNTDILSPLISVSSDGDVLINLLHELVPFETANRSTSAATSYQSVAFSGPAGILPPGGYSQMYFEVRQSTPLVGREELLVAAISDLQLPHAYLAEKDSLQPAYVPDNVWDTIWDNALMAVGLTWASFQKYTSAVATQMSLVHDRRPLSSDDIMEYSLKVADGFYTARILMYIEDISSDVGDMPLPLVVHRYYSSYISKRRTSGPCGKGWLLSWWELRIIKNTLSEVVIQKDREYIAFRVNENGLYVNGESQITVTDDELVYDDPNTIEVYIFNRVSGRLARIENLVDESHIIIHYNSRQQPVSFIHSNGDTMAVTYTDRGLINFVDIMDQGGNVKQSSAYAYDASGVHLMTVTIGDQSAIYRYNEKGDLIEAVAATLEQRRFSYDDSGLMVESAVYSDSESLVSSVAITYDWTGLVTMNLQPENRTIITYIDSEGTPKLFSSSPDSPPIVQIYLPTSNGRMLVVGDQVLSETRMDAETNTLHLTDGNGNEIEYELGESGEIVSLVDSGRQRYGARYTDAAGVEELSNPDGTQLVVHYGSDGHISGLTNPDMSEILFSYDTDDNLISKVADGVESRYEYDGNRRLIRGTNDKGTLEISYSREGVPVKVTYPNGRQLSYGYNAKFQRVYIADNSGYNVSYTYNSEDRLAEVRQEHSGQWVVRFSYTARGELARKTFAGGAYTDYDYDSEGRLLTLRNFNNIGTLMSWFIYEYDLNGQILAVRTLNGRWSFKYDAISQLIAWEDPSGLVTAVRYDSRGNRLTETHLDNTTSYSVNNVNQYLSYGENDTFTYDMNSNLKQKITNGKRESFSYDSEGRLTLVEDPDKRCTYEYDALGTLYRKECSDGSSYNYLMDPFGPYGPDVIAEISGQAATYFVHSMDQGLLAALESNREWYYQFNGDKSVVGVMAKDGVLMNSYHYDPFGRIIQSSESVRNIFQYVGQLGVIKDEAVENVYMMRARHYDATHGRFMSFDPLGFAANTPNQYMYARNNPLAVKDPTGEIASFLAGSLESVATYSLTTPPSKYSAGGFVGSAVSGAVPIPVVGDALGSITEDLIDRGAVNWRDVAKDASWGAAFGQLRKKIRRLLPGGSGKLLKSIGKKAKWLIGPVRNVWNRLKTRGPRFLRDSDLPQFLGGVVRSKVQGRIRSYVEGLPQQLKKYWTGFVEWIVSIDPNDIIGPSGYGDARFIPANLVLEYKIRFENDPNATAPAQRVFISHHLDDDVDVRTFRIGSFGFGDFTQNVTVQRAFIQDVINVTESLGVLVRVRAGIDVVSNEATWNLQAIDPETGEAPIDPSVGFLPPNNGTTGQGFVTFTVRAKQQLGPLPTIDAVASIIFDRNEPIDTPPIFNTIDNIAPTVNVTAIHDLLIAGTPAVSLSKSDVGSGVATVDLYILADGQLRPLVQGTAEDTAILPLTEGSQYQVVAMALDNVGNMQALDDALRNILPLNITMVRITCPNDCSGQGSCTAIGTCQCESGFYGSDCSQVLTAGICPQISERIGILNFTFHWPDTGAGEIFAIQCPCRDITELTEDLFAIRECGADGSWLQTEFSTCLSNRIMVLCESGFTDPTETLFDILELPDTLTSGDIAILFSAASTLLTNQSINNDTVRDKLLDAFDDLLSTDDDILIAISETTRIGGRLLSSFDKFGETLQLIPEMPFMINRISFSLSFVELDSNDLPDDGYIVKFGGVDGDQVNLPKSLFGGDDGNSSSRLSSSHITMTTLFRGRDDSITINSNILTIDFLGQEIETNTLTEPVTLKFRKSATNPIGYESSCRWLNISGNGVADTWSKEGCRLLNETQEEVICSCDQLSSFAVVLTVADAVTPPPVTTPSTDTTPPVTTGPGPFVVPLVVPFVFLMVVIVLIVITLAISIVVAIIIALRRCAKDLMSERDYSVEPEYSMERSRHIPVEVVANLAVHVGDPENQEEKETPFVV